MGEVMSAAEPERTPAVTIPALALVVIAGEARDVEALATRWFTPEEVTRVEGEASGDGAAGNRAAASGRANWSLWRSRTMRPTSRWRWRGWRT